MTETTTPSETPAPETPEAPADKPKDQLGDSGKRALAEERQARREAERQASEARERAAELERAEVRRAVASEKGLTPAQARFLDGDDEEAMRARADELLEAFTPEEKRDLKRRPVEKTLRTGATARSEPQEKIGTVADRVLE